MRASISVTFQALTPFRFHGDRRTSAERCEKSARGNHTKLARKDGFRAKRNVYGQLLPLPWIIDASSRDDPVAEYGEIAGWPAWKAREKMRTVNLGTPCPATKDLCFRWIREAEYILVLGFGHDDSNLKHIGLAPLDAGKFIFSSGFELEEKCRNRVRSSIPPTVHFAGEHVDIATCLRTSELLDSAAKGKPAEHVFEMLRASV